MTPSGPQLADVGPRNYYALVSHAGPGGREHHTITAPRRGPNRERARRAILAVLRRAEENKQRVGFTVTYADRTRRRPRRQGRLRPGTSPSRLPDRGTGPLRLAGHPARGPHACRRNHHRSGPRQLAGQQLNRVGPRAPTRVSCSPSPELDRTRHGPATTFSSSKNPPTATRSVQPTHLAAQPAGTPTLSGSTLVSRQPGQPDRSTLHRGNARHRGRSTLISANPPPSPAPGRPPLLLLELDELAGICPTPPPLADVLALTTWGYQRPSGPARLHQVLIARRCYRLTGGSSSD